MKFTLTCNAQQHADGCKVAYCFDVEPGQKDKLVAAFAECAGMSKLCREAGMQPKKARARMQASTSARVLHTDEDLVSVSCARCRTKHEMTFAQAKGWRLCSDCSPKAVPAKKVAPRKAVKVTKK